MNNCRLNPVTIHRSYVITVFTAKNHRNRPKKPKCALGRQNARAHAQTRARVQKCMSACTNVPLGAVCPFAPARMPKRTPGRQNAHPRRAQMRAKMPAQAPFAHLRPYALPGRKNARPRAQLCARAPICPPACPNTRPDAKLPAHVPRRMHPLKIWQIYWKNQKSLQK